MTGSVINKRVYVEKKPGFRTEALDLYADLRENLNISATGLRLINTYDVFGIDPEICEAAEKTVFTEVMIDDLIEPDFSGCVYFAAETLPGQYDQRADSAVQCIKLLDPSSDCRITCGKIIILEGNEEENRRDLDRIKKYLINPIESREKDLSILAVDRNVDVTPLEVYPEVLTLDRDGIASFIRTHGLAMSLEDCLLIQDYFRSEEKRNPTETEIRVLDTYWSDHCRHTTFETSLQNITIRTDRFGEEIQKAFDRYLEIRRECGRSERPMTLMDMGTINAKYLRSRGLLKDVEVSEEINACSIFINVDHDGVPEKWLLMFKNETHNPPTEIEPFGGASTCIGGAIRDPLSGRSYVYQAMRISGCGNVLAPVEDTLPGKLPQKIISKKATRGNSSYGNQIGLPTTFAKEVYHPDFVAKHMEVGAVVGAAPAENVVRKTPEPGDVIILLGGRTGRDGIGGATGSSKEHNQSSLTVCASEVQKGNAPEERKIQRLFRNPDCTKLIRKCNDFGAGGVCVAIGELAPGLMIHLENVRTKYAGLNATELAVSESQERMAVVVSGKDEKEFIRLAEAENLEAYRVAEVIEEPRLVICLNDQKVVDISRAFIDTCGVRQRTDVVIGQSDPENPFEVRGRDGQLLTQLTKEAVLETLSDMNVASQKGLAEMFDASIGSTTVMMPFGGRMQLTPTQASVQKIPVLDGKTTTCSILAYGYDPAVMKYSCFAGAMYSVLSSMAKTVAVGGRPEDIRFSFQEYFERLNKDPVRWGKVTEALLGAMTIQDFFDLASIGGKDSMSGTFNTISVPPTLISFACSAGSTKNIITPELKRAGNFLTLFRPEISAEGLPSPESYKEIFENVRKGIAGGKIISAYVAEQGGVLPALMKMSFGNELGFDISDISADQKGLDLIRLMPGAIITESERPLDAADAGKYAALLGKVTDSGYTVRTGSGTVSLTKEEALSAWMKTFDALYPVTAPAVRDPSALPGTNDLPIRDFTSGRKFKAAHPVDVVKVLIPVFPGSNCEYDVKRAFEEEGAEVTVFVFRNMTESAVFESIDEMADLIGKTNILAIPGGFSSGDEPDGSAKFIVNVLLNEKIRNAVHALLARDGLILGICNGFQALIKSGLLPYGEIRAPESDNPTLFRNTINRHVSCMVTTRVASDNSPWLAGLTPGECHTVPVSHGEGRFVASPEMTEQLFRNGQVAFLYSTPEGIPTMDGRFNPNGSSCAIEGIVSPDGRVLGKMGHSERYFKDVFMNIPGNKKQNIFANGVRYFRKE
ncbi:MAG: phosphoribosylformylglycinamidine synthase [Methanosarcinaceae archaeon]|nr:phosphoribosylformylglycinamidine synthase [Methanosarcinaceae archaeon]